MSTYPNIIAAKDARIAELEAENERLTKERDDLEARAIAMFWMLPDDTKVGDLQSLASKAIDRNGAADALSASQSESINQEMLEALRQILDRGYISEHIEEERVDYQMVSALIAKAEGSAPSSPWQPIETAPKDGTMIIITDGSYVGAGGWNPSVHGNSHPWVFIEDFLGHQPHGCCDNEDGSRIEVNGFTEVAITHWMPLPPAPSSQEEDAQ